VKEERTLPIEQFFKGPGKHIENRGNGQRAIDSKPLPNTGSAYYKLQRRLALDLPILGVSVLLSLDKNKSLFRPALYNLPYFYHPS